MGELMVIALSVLALSFVVFVAFFGRLPALRHTPIATLNRLLIVHLPNGILALDQKATSGRLSSSLARYAHYIMHDRHPTVLIFFFLLMVVSEWLYLPSAWPQMTGLQKLTGAIAITLPYVFLWLSSFNDPGFITPANHAFHLALYPYDFSIFKPGHECRTCGFLKPARSKHCSICKRCVARSDHHCIFINKCVGYGNHRWFVLLLFSTAVLCSYGGLLGTSLLTTKIKAQYPLWRLWKPRDMSWNIYLAIFGWSLQEDVGMGSVTLLTMLISPMVWGLLGYTIWLIYCGTSTNESLKWSDWQAEMDDGYAFIRPMPRNRQKNSRVEALWSRWPKETEQILVATKDGQFPSPDNHLPGEGEWERVWKLKDVENIYDLGFWDNMRDIFLPNYAFNTGRHEPIGERRRRTKRPARTSPL